jgi:uncharacterized protein (DUF3820 family)
MTFGKHRGKLICDVPSSYLRWILGEENFCRTHPQEKEMMTQELAYRDKWNKHFEE